ncbi:phenylalanine--tRNA ligase subunit alpha [Nanohaloarchaea archaeon]|nr:phenylalanine--tRNA ligase subunit alpha [Candidatus Nanohaloarchaea archaeon]
MELTSQAKEILEELKNDRSLRFEQLVERGYDQSYVSRASLELEEKGLAEVSQETQELFELTEEGQNVSENGSPEYRLTEELRNGPKDLSEIQNVDLDVALGQARKRDWISIKDGVATLLKDFQELEDEVSQKLNEGDYSQELVDRGLVNRTQETVRTVELTDKGLSLDPSDVDELFNVEADAEPLRTGKKHYYKNILNYARQTWIEMGFQEMEGNYVVPSFLNFDALYTPQDHPARELHDTFFVERPGEADLEEYGEKVDHVGQTHQHGWTTGSTGYQTGWNVSQAERNVVRTHTTAVSVQRLHEIDISDEDLPKKFFIVGRNFRNETVDRTHLAEFYQTDGIVVGRDLNFRNLKGYVTEFFEKMGYDDVRLVPSYYPYTEMSVEVQVYEEDEDVWTGMGGAGMFRPEVVKPMLGFEAKVLAWGLGIPRIAFMAAGLEDIRELYRNDTQLINQTPVWRPDWDQGDQS